MLKLVKDEDDEFNEAMMNQVLVKGENMFEDFIIEEEITNQELEQEEQLKAKYILRNHFTKEMIEDDMRFVKWSKGLGESKINKITKIYVDRISKLNLELIYFISDLTKEIMFDAFGIECYKLKKDISKIIWDMIPRIEDGINKIFDLIPKYEKVDDMCYKLPNDYHYESKLYTK